MLRGLGRGVAAVQRRNTTILCVRKGDKVVIMGDQQVTLGEKYVAKATTKKLRRAGDSVMVGFAGSTADAMTLLEKLENKLTEFPGQLLRACVELAKEWRGDKAMRQLNCSMIVANDTESLEIDGLGNVITPEEDGVLAIGSGGMFAKSAARALVDIEGMDAEAICRKSMKVATAIDVFSNDNYTIDYLDKNEEAEKKEKQAEKEKKEAEESLKVELKITPTGEKKGGDSGSDAGSGSSKSTGEKKGKKSKGGDGLSAALAEHEETVLRRVEDLLEKRMGSSAPSIREPGSSSASRFLGDIDPRYA